MNESKILLVGNGPSALAKEVGSQIDAFDGKVARFNHFSINGYEKYVGSRTDIWITCANFAKEVTPPETIFVSWARDAKTTREVDLLNATRVPREILLETVQKMNFRHPSSGAMATTYFLNQGYHIWLWGFDFLCTRRPHHYNNDVQKRGEWHDDYKEWLFFNLLEEQGKVHWFGHKPDTESIPIVRQPVPCGKDDNISWYREPAHNAWYRWFGEISRGRSVLDVGAGTCKGMEVLEEYCPKVWGQDIDPRLHGLHKNLFIGGLEELEDKSFDVVTCVDVIEHVIEDKVLFDHLKRIAREKIFITTPCATRSKCGNIAHCREYTIAQFTNNFKPSEVWSASPDGTVHKTLLLKRWKDRYIDHTYEGPENRIQVASLPMLDRIPLDKKFNQTVDKQEWAHICGIFDGQEI